MFKGIKNIDELLKIAAIIYEDMFKVISPLLEILRNKILNKDTSGIENFIKQALEIIAHNSLEDELKIHPKEIIIDNVINEDGCGELSNYLESYLRGRENLENFDPEVSQVISYIFSIIESYRNSWPDIVKNSDANIISWRKERQQN